MSEAEHQEVLVGAMSVEIPNLPSVGQVRENIGRHRSSEQKSSEIYASRKKEQNKL